MKKIFLILALILGIPFSQARSISGLNLPEPRREDFVVSGFRLSKIEKGSVYDKMGFKEGDIIKNYNGLLIKGPSDFKNMFLVEGKLTVVIERAGKEVTLVFEIKE